MLHKYLYYSMTSPVASSSSVIEGQQNRTATDANEENMCNSFPMIVMNTIAASSVEP